MISLKITGDKGTYDISQKISSATWSGDYRQCARSLSFDMLPQDAQANLGDSVVLRGEEGEVLFDGYIFSRQKSTKDSVLSCQCFDRGFYLRKNTGSYKFKNQTPEGIAKRVCADFGIETGDLAVTNVAVTRNYLGNTLYDIIMDAYTMASRKNKNKYYVIFRGKKLCVLARRDNIAARIIENGVNLMEASVTESVEDMINQVAVYDKNDKLITTVKNQEAIKLYGVMQGYVKQSGSEGAADKAQEILDDKGDVEQKITVEGLGDTKCVSGWSVIVREPSTGLQGMFYIDGDTHTWKNGQYYQKLVLNFKQMMDEKETGSAPN